METKAFGELSRPEQVKLFEAWLDGIPIEFRSRAKYGVWTRTPTPAWADDHYYRIATIPDRINWDHVHPDFKYMASNVSGLTYLFTEKPEMLTRLWIARDGMCIPASSFSSYKKGTTDWKDSLVERPK